MRNSKTSSFILYGPGKTERFVRGGSGMARKILPLLAVVIFAAVWGGGYAFPNPQTADQSSAGAPSAQTGRPPEKLAENGRVLGKQVKPRPGEMCLVCYTPIGPDDVVYLVKGQRVPLHAMVCYGELAKHPQNFLTIPQPHGAFLGAGAEEQAVSPAWFLAGLYVLLGLIFAAMCAHQALDRGRSPAGWFGAGLFFNAFGYLALLTRPALEVGSPGGVPGGLGKVAATRAPVPCPCCGKTNHPAAEECAGCGEKLRPAVDSDLTRAGLRSS